MKLNNQYNLKFKKINLPNCFVGKRNEFIIYDLDFRFQQLIRAKHGDGKFDKLFHHSCGQTQHQGSLIRGPGLWDPMVVVMMLMHSNISLNEGRPNCDWGRFGNVCQILSSLGHAAVNIGYLNKRHHQNTREYNEFLSSL